MGGNSDYATLLNQYNIAVAAGQNLQETLETRELQWDKREEDFKITEKLMRELCESILAKDPKEMVLGADYSWSSIPINELIIKTKKVFSEHNCKQKDFLQKMLDLAEDRRLQIGDLEEQIQLMKSSPATAATMTQEEIQERIKKEKQEKAAIASLPLKAQEAAAKGKIEVIMEKEDEEDEFEAIVLKDMADKGGKVQLTPKSIPVTPARKQLEKKRQRKEQGVVAHMVNLKEYEDKLNESNWAVLEVIGKMGLSRYTEIENAVFESEPSYTTNRVRIATEILANIGLLNKELIKNPLKGTLYVYQMTDMGSRIFKDKFGQMPVVSELDEIMSEHDNCVHGYGIRFIAEMLKDTGEYKEVCDTNRKTPIKLGGGIAYIPDIVCTDNNGAKMYIEYECANHTQTNFNAKCNKMCKVTSVLNFVAPNRDAVTKLMKEVENWIASRGNGKSLRHITVRITSAIQMKDMDLKKNKGWKVVYEPGRKEVPEINF